MDKVVHVLWEGFAICGLMEGFPGEWPPEHRWTYAWDEDNVTCPGCRRKLAETSALDDKSVGNKSVVQQR